MSSANVLEQLGATLLSRGVEVVDCSGVLGPDTPLLKLPEGFGDNTPKIEIHTISEYDDKGPHSPGPTVDCVEYLLSKEIVGWGNQCIGTDAGQAAGMESPFPAHNLLHKSNCYSLASLANLDKLPAKGAILIAAPLKFEKGTGSPIRALALVPKGGDQ